MKIVMPISRIEAIQTSRASSEAWDVAAATLRISLCSATRALANKLARIAWAVLVHQTTYEAHHARA